MLCLETSVKVSHGPMDITVVGSIMATSRFVQLHTAEYAVLADNVPDVSEAPFVVAVYHHTLADVASRDHLRIIGCLNGQMNGFGIVCTAQKEHLQYFL